MGCFDASKAQSIDWSTSALLRSVDTSPSSPDTTDCWRLSKKKLPLGNLEKVLNID